MSTNSEELEENDPFAPENIGTMLFIQQSRIYDVLMAILTHTDSTAANRLLEAHSNGDLLGPVPDFSGKFYSEMQQSND